MIMIQKCVISFFLFFYILSSQAQSIKNENISDVESLFSKRKYNEVIEILAEKKKTDSLSMREYYLITKSYGRTRQYANGFVSSQIMLNKSLDKRDTTNITIASNLILENLVDLDKMNMAIEAFNNSKRFFRKKDSIEFQKMCFKAGVALYHEHRYEEAYEVYNKITKKEYRELSLFTNNYALTLMGLSRYNEALFYFKKSIAINKQKKIKSSIPYGNIAEIYIEKKQWKLAKSYLDSSFKALNKKSQLTDRKYIYEKYFKLFVDQNKINQALVYLENIRRIDQKIFNKRINEKIVEIDNTYERESNLKKEVKTIDNKLIRAQKQRLWITIGALLIILGLISTAFYYQYKNIKTAHQNVVTEQKLLRSQMTPHFIFNSLSVLQGMILNKEDHNAVRYLSKFSKLLRLILESSREKLVLLEEELRALQNYVDLQNMQAQHKFEFTINLDESLEEKEIYIPPMIIQPFVENTIEHGFKETIKNPKLIVNLSFQNEQLNCEILDNGVGFNPNKKSKNENKNSLATKITSERLEILSKELNTTPNLKIENRSKYNEQGTRVTLTLPYKYENS